MTLVNVLEAKTNLSKLLQMLEEGKEDVVVIARNGKPIANLTLMSAQSRTPHFIGCREGLYDVPNDIDADNDEIAELFGA